MAGNEISDNNKRGIQGIYANTSDYNAVQTQIDTSIQKIETTFLAKIDSCQSSGEGGAKTVSATPCTQMIDGEGNGYKSPSYPALPHYRVQAGIAAVILDPVPGDIGVFSCTKRDSTNVSATSNDQQIPASMRSFSPSDAIMVGTVHTKAPTTWIHLKQDNTIVIHAPSGVKIESDTSVDITAPQVTVNATTVTVNARESTFSGHVTVQGGLDVSGGSGATVDGSFSATGDVSAGSISLQNHVHGGVQSGGSDTSTPK